MMQARYYLVSPTAPTKECRDRQSAAYMFSCRKNASVWRYSRQHPDGECVANKSNGRVDFNRL